MVNGATITGDSDWGKLRVGSIGGEYGASGVMVYPDATHKLFTLTRDAYGSGSGNVKLSIRGQATSFLWDDGSPSWEEYTAPVVKTWRYIQIKVEWKV